MTDREVIEAFIAHLRDHGFPGLKVDRWPEDENRSSKEIDTLAGPLAIEHTSVDTLPNQRRDSDWFMKAVGGIEAELSGSLPFRLNISLDYEAIAKGQRWVSIRNALKNWIIEDSPNLPDGRHILENVSGIPFRLRVTKASDRRPGLFIARYVPEDETLPERIRLQFGAKSGKLAKYKDRGLITVLLVESDDIALMNGSVMFEAICRAFPHAATIGVDQIWYADTSIPSEIEFIDFTHKI